MITREQWDSLTDQQQWDYVTLLESMVDKGVDGVETEPVIADEDTRKLPVIDEPPIDPMDTGAYSAWVKAHPGEVEDGDYGYGRTYW